MPVVVPWSLETAAVVRNKAGPMNADYPKLQRRRFLQLGSVAVGGVVLGGTLADARESPGTKRTGGASGTAMTAANLPRGNAPEPVSFPHFPSRLHAFVWRNWMLVPVERMARVVGAKPKDLLRMGLAMGLGRPPRITRNQQIRSYITVIRRNWHLSRCAGVGQTLSRRSGLDQ